MTQQPIKSKEEAAEVEAISFCYAGVWSMESPPGKIAADDSDKTRYSSFKRGFIAGWDAASKRVGNVWVKASERLPTVAGNYYCNVHYNTHRGFDEKDVKYFDGKHFPGDHQQPSLIPAIEWLDESTTPSLAEENRRLREVLQEIDRMTKKSMFGKDAKINSIVTAALASVSDAGNK